MSRTADPQTTWNRETPEGEWLLVDAAGSVTDNGVIIAES